MSVFEYCTTPAHPDVCPAALANPGMPNPTTCFSELIKATATTSPRPAEGLAQPLTIDSGGPRPISSFDLIVSMAPAQDVSSRVRPSWLKFLPCHAAKRASGPCGSAGSVTNQPGGAVGILTGSPLRTSLDHAGHSEFSAARGRFAPPSTIISSATATTPVKISRALLVCGTQQKNQTENTCAR